jgi:hypothetical protein
MLQPLLKAPLGCCQAAPQAVCLALLGCQAALQLAHLQLLLAQL